MVEEIRRWVREHAAEGFRLAEVMAAVDRHHRDPAGLLAWQKARDLLAKEEGLVFVCPARGTGRYVLADDKQRFGKAGRYGRKAVRARERQRDTLAAVDPAALPEGEGQRLRRAVEKNAEMMGLEKALAYRRKFADPAPAKPAENPRHRKEPPAERLG